MAVKKLKPDTPSQRYMSVSSFDELTTNKPYRKLTTPIKKTGGRNNSGRITSRRRGGGHKRRYRIIDFKRNKFDVSGEVLTIEYDPNRSSRIALVNYADNEKGISLLPMGLKLVIIFISSKSESIPFNVGNAMPLSRIPDGMLVHNIELKIGKGGQLSRSAGAYARIMAKEDGNVTLRLPSGEVRMVNENCLATIGTVGNKSHENIKIGKAGRSRWLGKKT